MNALPKSLSSSISHKQPPPPASQLRPQISPPTSLDVLRYRYHHGTNLGSIFVLERWLTPSMFPSSCSGSSELDAVRACIQDLGIEQTKDRWEQHWARAISDADFEWLATHAKCTSLRVPVGYWTLGREFCAEAPFADAALGKVYEGAWKAVKKLICKAWEYGVGVLVDLHGLPGGGNGEAHSGTGGGRAEFWGSTRSRALGVRCVRFMVRELRGFEGVIGIQVVNEAVWDAKGLYEWYEEVLKAVEEIDESMPVYVSDGWDLGRALTWSNRLQGVRNPVVVDTHRYYTFSDKDRSQTPGEIINRIPNDLSELNSREGSFFDRGEAQVIVGEYSCVLDGQTWNRVPAADKEAYVKRFGQAQSSRWQQKAGGSYFWTLKMDWMDGGEWGFVEQVKKENILPPPYLLLSKAEVQERARKAQQQRAESAKDARASHEDYWNRTSPGKHFEHERYSQGWDVGFSDALAFFVMRSDGGLGTRAEMGRGGDLIGCKEIWVKKRMLESGQGGPFAWEWEQGFRAGLSAFNRIVLAK